LKKSPVATEYQQTLETIAAHIEQSRREALRTVNRALVELYWFIGQVITERQERAGWGDAVVEQLARDLRMRFPDMPGLSVQNLWRMRQFYLAYRDEPILSPLVREISWTNHLLILGHTESATEREFYLRMNIRERWSKRDLERQLHSRLYERFALATPTGQTDKALATLPEVEAHLNEHIKDEYVLEFLGLTDTHSERELRKAILANLRDFFLEFGRHLTFVGEEYPIVVGGETYYTTWTRCSTIASCNAFLRWI
jgi:predicted nuclease of restriction endonuclease-like (RecB) superfamily